MDLASKKEFEKLSETGNEGRVMLNPNNEMIKETFASISNYKFQNTPLILETFN